MQWDFTVTATLVIFIVTYTGIAFGRIWGLKLDRAGITLLGAIAMLAFGCINLDQANKSINFQSILLLFGLMVVSSQLHFGGFYHWIAGMISKYMEKPALFLCFLMLSSGLLSAFLNNDVICFAFTPVITPALIRKKLNPVPFLIALAVSSNIGCTLTLIGNAQDVLVGEIAHLSFGMYIAWAVIPVTLSMTAAYLLILLLEKNNFQAVETDESHSVKEDDTPFKIWRTTKGLIVVVGIIVCFFIPGLPRFIVALVGAGLLLCSHRLESKKVLALVDWQLLILFIGLFVVVGAFHNSGLASYSVKLLEARGVNLQNPYTLAITTGIFSNIINNSAAVMLLVKVVDLNEKTNGYILALANTFAGNLFLIGSVANIIVVQGAANFGVKIKFNTFAKYGIPIALSSFVFLLCWIFVMKLV